MVMDQATRRAGERSAGPLAVTTAGLTKRFGGRTVVDDMALAIPSGSVCGFVGPNGAGKTTTIRMLLAVYLVAAITAAMTVFLRSDVTA